MNQAQLHAALQVELRAAGVDSTDAVVQRATCAAFRAVDSVLQSELVGVRGIGGFLLRILAPKTARGIRAVAAFIREYLTAHCRLTA